MKRVLIFSGKGGCGKTNLARHIAVAAVREGFKVVTVDLDPQRGLSLWWERRPQTAVHLVNLEMDWDDAGDLIRLGDRPDGNGPYDVMIIDTPAYGGYGNQPANLKILMKGSDAVLIPSRPTTDDATSSIPMLGLPLREKVPGYFILNATKPRVNILKMKRRFAAAGEMCPIEIGDRTVFSSAADDGLTALDLPWTPRISAAVDEMLGVWDYTRRNLGLPHVH